MRLAVLTVGCLGCKDLDAEGRRQYERICLQGEALGELAHSR